MGGRPPAFYGLSYLTGVRPTLLLASVVLVAGNIGDVMLVGGMPFTWGLTNYAVFTHSLIGAFLAESIKNGQKSIRDPSLK